MVNLVRIRDGKFYVCEHYFDNLIQQYPKLSSIRYLLNDHNTSQKYLILATRLISLVKSIEFPDEICDFTQYSLAFSTMVKIKRGLKLRSYTFFKTVACDIIEIGWKEKMGPGYLALWSPHFGQLFKSIHFS